MVKLGHIQSLYSQAKMFDNRSKSQPTRLMPWCLGIALLIQSSAAGHFPRRGACSGNDLQGDKMMSLVQINSQVSKEHVEEEEPLPNDTGNNIPTLDVAEVTSRVATPLTKVAPPGEDLSSRILVTPLGKDSSSKPSASASLHPEAVPRGQQSYQIQATSVGTKLLLKFKHVSMLLHDHVFLRLRQFHELAANMSQQRSGATMAVLVVAGVLILVLTFAALSHAQAAGRRSARSDYPPSGHGRAFNERSQRGSIAKLTTAGLRPSKDSTAQQPPTPDVVGLSRNVSRMSAMVQGPEGTEENPDPDSYFCPDLVVPPGCECILKVPTASLSRGSFTVTDVNDKTVLHVEPRSLNVRPSIVPGGRDAEQRQQHRLMLTTEYGTIMAQCGPSLTQAGECVLLRAAGDHFAKIACTEEKAYTLMTRTGLKFFFWGTFEDYSMNVIDSSGKLIAKTGSISELPASCETIGLAASQSSHGAPIYRLQVAPLSDVGLVLCGLLCIQHIM